MLQHASRTSTTKSPCCAPGLPVSIRAAPSSRWLSLTSIGPPSLASRRPQRVQVGVFRPIADAAACWTRSGLFPTVSASPNACWRIRGYFSAANVAACDKAGIEPLIFLEKTDVALTLYLRRSSRLQNPDPSRVKIVEGDVLDAGALRDAMRGQDVVYANLVGDMRGSAGGSSLWTAGWLARQAVPERSCAPAVRSGDPRGDCEPAQSSPERSPRLGQNAGGGQ